MFWKMAVSDLKSMLFVVNKHKHAKTLYKPYKPLKRDVSEF